MQPRYLLVCFLAVICLFPAGHIRASPDVPQSGELSITMLYDAFGRVPDLRKDWGFAALVEYRGKRILFDTGNSAEIFADNVAATGTDLAHLDFAVVSHRHGDHASGLSYLLKVNPKVSIYVPQENFGVFGATLPGTFYRRNPDLPASMRYFDGAPPEILQFGSAWPGGQFHWIEQTTEVTPGVHLILLKGEWGVDLAVMELSLAIETPQGIVLLVGCAHPGIENIVTSASRILQKPVYLVAGGLHLLPAADEEIERIAHVLHDDRQVQWLAPAHCTGEPAFAILKQVFRDHYLYAGLGSVLHVDPTLSVPLSTAKP